MISPPIGLSRWKGQLLPSLGDVPDGKGTRPSLHVGHFRPGLLRPLLRVGLVAGEQRKDHLDHLVRSRDKGLTLPQPLLPLPKQSLELPGALDRGVVAGCEDSAQDLRTLLVDPPHPQERPARYHARHQSGVRGQVLLRGEPRDVSNLFQDDLRGVEVHPGGGHQLLDGGVPSPELCELSLDLLPLMSQDFELRQEPFDQVALGERELGGGLGHLLAPCHPKM